MDLKEQRQLCFETACQKYIKKEYTRDLGAGN